MNPDSKKADWIAAFAAALRKLQLDIGSERLADLGEEIWPHFGHVDPAKVARAAHKIWRLDQ